MKLDGLLILLLIFLPFVYLGFGLPRHRMARALKNLEYRTKASVRPSEMAEQPAFSFLSGIDVDEMLDFNRGRFPTACSGRLLLTREGWRWTPMEDLPNLGVPILEGKWADVLAGEAFWGSLVQEPSFVLFLSDGSRFRALTEDVERLQKMLDALGVKAPEGSAKSTLTGLAAEVLDSIREDDDRTN